MGLTTPTFNDVIAVQYGTPTSGHFIGQTQGRTQWGNMPHRCKAALKEQRAAGNLGTCSWRNASDFEISNLQIAAETVHDRLFADDRMDTCCIVYFAAFKRLATSFRFELC